MILTTNNLPAHSHALMASSATGTQASPSGAALSQINTSTGKEPTLAAAYGTSTPNVTMASASIGVTGGSQPIATLPPYLGINFIIALQGIYPPRS